MTHRTPSQRLGDHVQGYLVGLAIVLAGLALALGPIALYAAAGLVMLLAGWPAMLAGALALPYILSTWPFRSLPDQRADEANRGWRRFLWLNLLSGFLLTQLLIVMALTG